jgi:hypothetical protein
MCVNSSLSFVAQLFFLSENLHRLLFYLGFIMKYLFIFIFFINIFLHTQCDNVSELKSSNVEYIKS